MISMDGGLRGCEAWDKGSVTEHGGKGVSLDGVGEATSGK